MKNSWLIHLHVVYMFHYRKDRHMVEKLEAQMEYAEAHDNPDEARKLEERIQNVVDKADARKKAPHDAEVKVVHHGHKHLHDEST